MFDANVALQTLIWLAASLAILFLFILGYTFWTRKKKEYWQRYEQKFRDYFFSLLFEYTEKPDEEREPDEIIKKITKRTKDYSFFLKLLDDLTDILDGEQRNHLDDLMNHPVFLSFYKDKLFHGSRSHKIFACIYFQKSGNINDRIQAKLVTISKSNNLKLAYSATKALQSAKSYTIRKSALLRFFRRENITELMISELLHLFDPGNIEDRPKVAEQLKSILLENIDVASKTIIVRYMGYKNFHASSDFLFQFLKRIQYTHSKSPLVQALIISLSKLYNLEAVPLIKNYVTRNDVDKETQIAAVKALSTFGGEANLAFLIQQLLKVEFSIRKEIIREFASREKRIKLLGQFIITNLNFVQQFQHLDHPPKHLKKFVQKIQSVALGIKIALSHRLTNTHV